MSGRSTQLQPDEPACTLQLVGIGVAYGGMRALHACQHLHGGMGADIDYPVHRYFLWGKQIEDTLGGASATLSRLGRRLAEAST